MVIGGLIAHYLRKDDQAAKKRLTQIGSLTETIKDSTLGKEKFATLETQALSSNPEWTCPLDTYLRVRKQVGWSYREVPVTRNVAFHLWARATARSILEYMPSDAEAILLAELQDIATKEHLEQFLKEVK